MSRDLACGYEYKSCSCPRLLPFLRIIFHIFYLTKNSPTELDDRSALPSPKFSDIFRMFLGFFQKLDSRFPCSVLFSQQSPHRDEERSLRRGRDTENLRRSEVMGEKPALQPINSKLAATYSLSPTSTSRPSIVKNDRR